MRKFFVLLTSAALLLVLLIGCGTNPQPAEGATEGTTTPQGSGILGEEVMDNFKEYISNSELSEHYSITELPQTTLPESGETYQTIVIQDKIADYSYHFSVRSSPTGEASTVVLNTIDPELGYLAMPTFCLYLYKALELPPVDGMEFCDRFGLFSQEPSGSMYADGWNLWASHSENIISFTAIYLPE